MASESILINALNKPEELQRLVSEHLLELVYIKDLSGKVLYVSPSVSNILGYSIEEYVKNAGSIEEESSKYSNLANEVRQEYLASDSVDMDQLPMFFTELKTSSGMSVIHETRERFIREDGKRIALLGISVDVSDYLRQLEDLQGNNQNLMVIHHAQKMLVDLTGIHEIIRAGLEAIMSMLEFDCGAVFIIHANNMNASLINSFSIPKKTVAKIESFSFEEQINSGEMVFGDKTSALLLPPGHSWLKTLDPMGKHVCGIFFLCNGVPEAFIALNCLKVFSRSTSKLLLAVGSLISRAIENSYLHSAIENLSVIDTLTGLHNKTYTDKLLAREGHLIHRYKKTASIILLKISAKRKQSDCDSDESEAILKVAMLLQKSVRATDVLSRYGEDEFLFFLPETGEKGTKRLDERCLNIIEGWNKDQSGDCFKLKLKTGSSTTVKGDKTMEEMLEEARGNI